MPSVMCGPSSAQGISGKRAGKTMWWGMEPGGLQAGGAAEALYYWKWGMKAFQTSVSFQFTMTGYLGELCYIAGPSAKP